MEDEPKTFSVYDMCAERTCITMHAVISPGVSNVWQLNLRDLGSNWEYLAADLQRSWEQPLCSKWRGCSLLRPQTKVYILTWVWRAPGLLRQFGVLCLRRHDESNSDLVPLRVFKFGVKWCMSCLLTVMGLHLRIWVQNWRPFHSFSVTLTAVPPPPTLPHI